MKKIIFLLTIFVSLNTFAQTKTETFDLLERNYAHQLEVLKIQDDLLKSLLQIPFDKRVYVYPALFESNLTPKKIMTHPQIIIWKGKKPTKIAPQMQEFAKEHLDYMPAKFYPLLDPDVWPTQPKENDWHHVGHLLKDTIVTPDGSDPKAQIQKITDRLILKKAL